VPILDSLVSGDTIFAYFCFLLLGIVFSECGWFYCRQGVQAVSWYTSCIPGFLISEGSPFTINLAQVRLPPLMFTTYLCPVFQGVAAGMIFTPYAFMFPHCSLVVIFFLLMAYKFYDKSILTRLTLHNFSPIFPAFSRDGTILFLA